MYGNERSQNGCVRLCTVMNALKTVMYGYVRLCTVKYGQVRMCTIVYGHVRLRYATVRYGYGYVKISMRVQYNT